LDWDRYTSRNNTWEKIKVMIKVYLKVINIDKNYQCLHYHYLCYTNAVRVVVVGGLLLDYRVLLNVNYKDYLTNAMDR
jgi:hypothetical protein